MGDLEIPVGAYYDQMATLHEAPMMPLALGGHIIQLLPPGQEVSILNPSKGAGTELTTNYSNVLTSLGPFLGACAVFDGRVPFDPGAKPHGFFEGHVAEMARRLLIPSGVSTGRLTNIQLQAAQPRDFTTNTLMNTLQLRLKESTERVNLAVASAVLLVISAELGHKTPRAPAGYSAFLNIVGLTMNGQLTNRARQLPQKVLADSEHRWRPKPASA
jgi:hypothetical protein